MSELEMEVEKTMRFVADIARSRHPWLDQLRDPTDAEFRAAELVIERFPTPEQEIDRTPTVVLVMQ